MVRKFEHQGTPSCLLRGAGAVAQPVPKGAGAAARFRDTGLAEVYWADTQRAWLYRAGAPAAAAAAASSRCRRLSQTILQTPTPLPHNMSAAAAAGTWAAAWERIQTEPDTREVALAAAVVVQPEP